MKNINETSAVAKALKRFETNTKIEGHSLNLKRTRVPMAARTAMNVIWTRLHNNTEDELINGVKLLRPECLALGLPAGASFSIFYLDRNPINNQRMIVYFTHD